jgi:phosphoglycerate kinase
MEKLFIEDLPIQGKKILLRADFNVPLDSDMNVIDATRIEACLPSMRYILDKGGSLILMSHLGRPRNERNPALSLKPIAKELSKILEKEVQMAPDCIGHQVKELVDNMQSGDVLLLENLRFYRAEEHPEEDSQFAKELASFGNFYVNDAFGTAHRKHSSTYAICNYFPGRAAAGYLMEKEIRFLSQILMHPERPFYAIIGGAKISTKIGILKSLIKKVDGILIGGGMAFTFLKARGISIGESLHEDDLLPVAKELMDSCDEKKILFLLPRDFLIAREISQDAETSIVEAEKGIPKGYYGADIGPQSIDFFASYLLKAKTILWNGPLGVFECENFAGGTYSVAEILARSQATTVIGGGDSISAVKAAGFSSRMTHLSTGGGATLEFIEQGTLPGIEALSSKSTVNK